MRCFKKFINDRTCDLCSAINSDIYNECKQFKQQEIETIKKIADKQSRCIYRRTCYDEYTLFDACNKNGNGHGRFADECNPTLTCHIKGEDNEKDS